MNSNLELKEEVLVEINKRDSKIAYLETRVNQLESLITSIIKTSMEHIIVDIVID